MSGFGFGASGLLNTGLNSIEPLVFSTTDPLIIDGVVFKDFEIPSVINFGGTQKLTVHRLPGGERIIDAMGREEDAPSWSGVFLGPDAIPRAKQLDVMRADGNRRQLTWGTLSYTIVIRSFQPEYTFAYHIPYKISCEVLRDNSAPVPDNSTTPGQAVSNDVSDANTAVPADAPQDQSATVKAETSKGATVTHTYLPEPPIPPTAAQVGGAGNNAAAAGETTVNLGPSAAIPQGMTVGEAMTNAQTSASEFFVFGGT